MASSYPSNISSVDALWTLIQEQTQSVKDALFHRMIEAEESKKTRQQQQFVRKSLKQAFNELKDAKATNKELPDARDLFRLMDEEWLLFG